MPRELGRMCYSLENSLIYCIVNAVNELEAVDCNHRINFSKFCDLFSRAKRLCVVKALVKLFITVCENSDIFSLYVHRSNLRL